MANRAVRWVAQWFSSSKRRWARRFHRWAERLEPSPPTDAPAENTPLGQPRYEVKRSNGPVWSLYDGPKGAIARNKFLHEKQINAPGKTAFFQDGVMRDIHPSGASWP